MILALAPGTVGCAGVLGALGGAPIPVPPVPIGVGLGVVSFEPVSDTATEITLKLRSAFDPSISGQSAEQYLLSFKKLLENPQ